MLDKEKQSKMKFQKKLNIATGAGDRTMSQLISCPKNQMEYHK